MTEAANPPAPELHPEPGPELRSEIRPEIRDWCEAWKNCLQNVLSQVAGQPHAIELSAQPLAAAAADLCYTVVAGGAVHGEMTLRLPAASGIVLAQKFLGDPAPAEGSLPDPAAPAISPEHKEALEELLRQIAGLASTALAAIVGGEVKLHISPAAAPAWSSDAVACLRHNDPAGTSITLEIKISPALAAEIQSRALARPQSQAQPQAQAQAQATSAAPLSPPATVPESLPAPASSYRRLMDVGLDVKLRFGTRRMLLRDVLALSAGVVVELDDSLHSPVDLLLDGRLIAQGDVVIVDGKYGLRVTRVADAASAAGGIV